MSVSEATTRWSDPESVLAPIVVGAHEVSGYFLYPGGALRAAAGAIPPCGNQVKAVLRKATHPRIRKAVCNSGDPAKPFSYVVQLVEVGENEPRPIPLGHVLWSAGLTPLGKDVPGLGPDVEGFALEVNFIKVTGKGMLFAGLQLALLRHLWVEYMRTYDPDLIVMGGQTRFDDEWWRPMPEPTK
jgi:hypothetical protein